MMPNHFKIGQKLLSHIVNTNELAHGKTNEMTSVPSVDSDQSGHPLSLIEIFVRCCMGS